MNQASTIAPLVDNLFLTLIIVCGSVFFVIIATLFFLGVKYQARAKIDRSSPPTSSIILELGWTLPTLLIFIGFFFWGANLYTASRAVESIDLEVFVIAKQWMWKFQHPDGKREIDELHIPVRKKIKLTMISEDVVHSLFIPDFRIKQDILPQRYTSLLFEATKPGVYPLLCTQYCGVNHSRMLARIVVMNDSDFKAWSNLTGTRMIVTKIVGADLSLSGKRLFNSLGCSVCHATQPAVPNEEPMVGPTLWNLYGSLVTLQNGEKVRADDNYIHECVFKPNTKRLKGFEPVMPSFEGLITEEDFPKLLAFIKSLKSGKKP